MSVRTRARSFLLMKTREKKMSTQTVILEMLTDFCQITKLFREKNG